MIISYAFYNEVNNIFCLPSWLRNIFLYLNRIYVVINLIIISLKQIIYYKFIRDTLYCQQMCNF